MQVILLERIEKLGQMGEVVDVKAGYARNFLLPRNKALRATEDNIETFESRRVQLEADNFARREEAEKVSGNFDGLTVALTRQASDSAQLYGSVTKRDIAEAMVEAGFTIARNQVALDRPIKTVGLHPVRVQLHPEVSVTITVNVARTQDEAEAQARGETIGADYDDDEIGGVGFGAERADEEPAPPKKPPPKKKLPKKKPLRSRRPRVSPDRRRARPTRNAASPARCHEPRQNRLRRRVHPPGAKRAQDARQALRLGRAR